jgi:RNA-directed DNA polymerase
MMLHGVKYVVEVDVVGYFDHVNWEWLNKFLRHRVNDGGLLRLVNKWLRAGVMEDGVVVHTEEGTPQGGPVSPILANVYLHYVLDLWFERRFKKTCRRWVELTRYADDFVAAFQDQADAERFRREVGERLAAFGLKVAPQKTGIRHFDRNLIKGPGRTAMKPESFTFLGFTHFITKTRNKKVNIVRTPSIQARVRFLRRVAEWLRANRHVGPRLHQEHLTKMLQGFYQYFGL